MKKIILIILAFFIVGAGVLAFAVLDFVNSRPVMAQESFIYEVKPGSTLSGVARQLAAKGVVSDEFKFRLYARILGQANNLKVGEYELRSDMTPRNVLEVITSGQSISRRFTVSEGLNIWEIAALYESQGFGLSDDFLSVVSDSELAQELLGEPYETLEGYLFPETYGITRYTTTKELVRRMVNTFIRVFDEVSQGQNNFGMTRHELVTFASIIEKETGAPEERPLISGVFHNRMQKNMRLQTDPTVLYGIWDSTGDLRLRITRKDLRTPTRYNTYTQGGLPYGPIANPGKDALIATFAPEPTSYLFFVSRNDGTHVFSETYAEHRKAVEKWQLNPKAREGRSWRDLQKRRNMSAEAD